MPMLMPSVGQNIKIVIWKNYCKFRKRKHMLTQCIINPLSSINSPESVCSILCKIHSILITIYCNSETSLLIFKATTG